MSTTEDPSDALRQIAARRLERREEADERLGELLGSVDVYVWHIDHWLEEPMAKEQSLTDQLNCPRLCIERSLWGLLNIVIEGLTTAAEYLRAGIAYPGPWLLRNLLEASTNAAFIANEPTRLSGQRWMHYNVERMARLSGDAEIAKEIIDAIRSRFPDENINREGWWARTTDSDGNSKLFANLIDRATYVEKIGTPKPSFVTTLRQSIFQHQLGMIRNANLTVHPMLTGYGTAAHPIVVLYWGHKPPGTH